MVYNPLRHCIPCLARGISWMVIYMYYVLRDCVPCWRIPNVWDILWKGSHLMNVHGQTYNLWKMGFSCIFISITINSQVHKQMKISKINLVSQHVHRLTAVDNVMLGANQTVLYDEIKRTHLICIPITGKNISFFIMVGCLFYGPCTTF